MRYIKFSGGTGYCGCGFEEVEEFPDSASDTFLDGLASDKAYDNGESFTYCATGWGEDFESEQDEQDYYESCYCDWKEISKEEYERILKEGF